MPEAKLTSKGQLVLPKMVREHLDVKYGDRVDFVIQPNGEVVVRAATRDIRTLAGLLAPAPRVVSLEEMDQAVRDAAVRRDQRSRHP